MQKAHGFAIRISVAIYPTSTTSKRVTSAPRERGIRANLLNLLPTARRSRRSKIVQPVGGKVFVTPKFISIFGECLLLGRTIISSLPVPP
ncbi:hypothetical protein BC936DRAFT_138521 [Jimgerdemannia flammicorona]|uniref:Uncharacterized protein n=1 Tax=Jimgerdemannia flammicorona TaxID=994334 RepID=A0A433C7S6_9FUNG|nr:hypothetical protein BC936DRAFT_138521 [Jimgerdemannia flammicorona]